MRVRSARQDSATDGLRPYPVSLPIFRQDRTTVAERQRNNEGVGSICQPTVKELHGRGRYPGSRECPQGLIPTALTADIHIGTRRCMGFLLIRAVHGAAIQLSGFIRPKLGKDQQAASISFNQYHPFLPGKH